MQLVLSGISSYGFSVLREWDKHRDWPAGACHFIFTMWHHGLIAHHSIIERSQYVLSLDCEAVKLYIW